MRLDGHAHVFLKNLPMASNRRYTPASDALPEEYFSLLKEHGLEGSLLVQPSFLGYDNIYLLDVLESNRLNPNGLNLFGICMISERTSLNEIQDMQEKGIIGVRLNYVQREIPNLSSRGWQKFFTHIKDVNWHLELHIEKHRLEDLIKFIPKGINIVVDHFFLSNNPESLNKLLDLAETHLDFKFLFAKLSAPYRLPAYTKSLNTEQLTISLSELLNKRLGSDHLIWGSDWPFTQHEGMQRYGKSVEQGRQWAKINNQSFGAFPSQLLPGD